MKLSKDKIPFYGVLLSAGSIVFGLVNLWVWALVGMSSDVGTATFFTVVAGVVVGTLMTISGLDE